MLTNVQFCKVLPKESKKRKASETKINEVHWLTFKASKTTLATNMMRLLSDQLCKPLKWIQRKSREKSTRMKNRGANSSNEITEPRRRQKLTSLHTRIVGQERTKQKQLTGSFKEMKSLCLRIDEYLMNAFRARALL